MIEGQAAHKLWAEHTASRGLKGQLAHIEQGLGQAQAHLVRIEHDLDQAPRHPRLWRAQLNPWHPDFSPLAYTGVVAAGMVLAFGVQWLLWAAGLM